MTLHERFHSPSVGTEKWTVVYRQGSDYTELRDSNGDLLLQGLGRIQIERVADAHNATLQPQDDTKRMDWLETVDGNRWITSFRADGLIFEQGEEPISAVTIRAAIDAAMRKEV